MNDLAPVIQMAGEDSAFLAALQLRSPLIQQGYEYWARPGWPHVLPQRRDVKPFEIPELIRNMVLIDVLDNPRDFRYRLMGTAVTAHLEEDRTGQKMSEIPFQASPSRIWDTCQKVATEGCPILSDVPYVGPHSEFMTAQDLVLPLFDDNDKVRTLLIFVDYLSKKVA